LWILYLFPSPALQRHTARGEYEQAVMGKAGLALAGAIKYVEKSILMFINPAELACFREYSDEAREYLDQA